MVHENNATTYYPNGRSSKDSRNNVEKVLRPLVYHNFHSFLPADQGLCLCLLRCVWLSFVTRALHPSLGVDTKVTPDCRRHPDHHRGGGVRHRVQYVITRGTEDALHSSLCLHGLTFANDVPCGLSFMAVQRPRNTRWWRVARSPTTPSTARTPHTSGQTTPIGLTTAQMYVAPPPAGPSTWSGAPGTSC